MIAPLFFLILFNYTYFFSSHIGLTGCLHSHQADYYTNHASINLFSRVESFKYANKRPHMNRTTLYFFLVEVTNSFCFLKKTESFSNIIFDTDRCEDTDNVNKFSIITNNDLTKLDKVKFGRISMVLAIFETLLRLSMVGSATCCP